ncbi:MAG: glutamine synthetase type III [Spirochaetae bacterium HGW-Spirochaetae-8]|nr:MAG: glutamine synthetase type III [Spirochaetae bacterium HGW-Spirochaetae-8]
MTMPFDFSTHPVSEIYGSNCFNESAMKKLLPASVFQELQAVQHGDKDLTPETAEAIASAMKQWAMEKGATHFTHWFQPLTGSTAEKHDSFINVKKNGKVVMEFSGKELRQGEPDASSFPNGGLRATFEARGYTAWDTSSPAFIKDTEGVKTLYIPTAFFSYNGQALDKKVPLLRSCDAIERQTLRVLRALGNTTSKHVTVSVGPEQEYFLVDREYYEKRPDLRLTGRTVYGNLAAKGQELDDHYFGSISDRVTVFMNELNYELWRVGIPSKTQHKEVAPGQFEVAAIYDAANLATDRNQLLMRILKSVAKRHGMKALTHEKPFAGVNGSGKHNNWSIATDDGQNLLSPGESPQDNLQFLLVLASLIKAVDTYAPLIRASAATAGNDHRLGQNEAPPAIISMFLGDQLSEILDYLIADTPYKKRDGEWLKLGVNALPALPKDMTDRNRTSPFAFTGNKFEFRMVGSSQSLAGPNTLLNAAVAEVFSEVADRLEKATDTRLESIKLIKEFYGAHKRVVFNGNGYSSDWVVEAERRGLPNLNCTVDALLQLVEPKNVALLTKHKVFTQEELESRLEVYLEIYSKQVNIEAGVMVEMARRSIVPAVTRYLSELCDDIKRQKALGFATEELEKIAVKISQGLNESIKASEALHIILAKALSLKDDFFAQARFYHEQVMEGMTVLRNHVDMLEVYTDKSAWPFPGYEELLFHL